MLAMLWDQNLFRLVLAFYSWYEQTASKNKIIVWDLMSNAYIVSFKCSRSHTHPIYSRHRVGRDIENQATKQLPILQRGITASAIKPENCEIINTQQALNTYEIGHRDEQHFSTRNTVMQTSTITQHTYVTCTWPEPPEHFLQREDLSTVCSYRKLLKCHPPP